MPSDLKRIPVEAAILLAGQYGFDEIVILARKVGAEGGGVCTTSFGVDAEHDERAQSIAGVLLAIEAGTAQIVVMPPKDKKDTH